MHALYVRKFYLKARAKTNILNVNGSNIFSMNEYSNILKTSQLKINWIVRLTTVAIAGA